LNSKKSLELKNQLSSSLPPPPPPSLFPSIWQCLNSSSQLLATIVAWFSFSYIGDFQDSIVLRHTGVKIGKEKWVRFMNTLGHPYICPMTITNININIIVRFEVLMAVSMKMSCGL
jgi:hypothetical protein